MPAPAAVGIDDDLAAGQAAIAVRAADHEAPGRVDVVDDVAVPAASAGCTGLMIFSMICAGFARCRSSWSITLGVVLRARRRPCRCAPGLLVVVLDRHLALAVGPQPRDFAVLRGRRPAARRSGGPGGSAAASARASRCRRSRTSGPGRRRPFPCPWPRRRRRPGRCRATGCRSASSTAQVSAAKPISVVDVADLADDLADDFGGIDVTALVVISPATMTMPGGDHRFAGHAAACGSWASRASRTPSEIWSASLSGWPMLTDSLVNKCVLRRNMRGHGFILLITVTKDSITRSARCQRRSK